MTFTQLSLYESDTCIYVCMCGRAHFLAESTHTQRHTCVCIYMIAWLTVENAQRMIHESVFEFFFLSFTLLRRGKGQTVFLGEQWIVASTCAHAYISVAGANIKSNDAAATIRMGKQGKSSDTYTRWIIHAHYCQLLIYFKMNLETRIKKKNEAEEDLDIEEDASMCSQVGDYGWRCAHHTSD